MIYERPTLDYLTNTKISSLNISSVDDVERRNEKINLLTSFFEKLISVPPITVLDCSKLYDEIILLEDEEFNTFVLSCNWKNYLSMIEINQNNSPILKILLDILAEVSTSDCFDFSPYSNSTFITFLIQHFSLNSSSCFKFFGSLFNNNSDALMYLIQNNDFLFLLSFPPSRELGILVQIFAKKGPEIIRQSLDEKILEFLKFSDAELWTYAINSISIFSLRFGPLEQSQNYILDHFFLMMTHFENEYFLISLLRYLTLPCVPNPSPELGNYFLTFINQHFQVFLDSKSETIDLILQMLSSVFFKCHDMWIGSLPQTFLNEVSFTFLNLIKGAKYSVLTSIFPTVVKYYDYSVYNEKLSELAFKLLEENKTGNICLSLISKMLLVFSDPNIRKDLFDKITESLDVLESLADENPPTSTVAEWIINQLS